MWPAEGKEPMGLNDDGMPEDEDEGEGEEPLTLMMRRDLRIDEKLFARLVKEERKKMKHEGELRSIKWMKMMRISRERLRSSRMKVEQPEIARKSLRRSSRRRRC